MRIVHFIARRWSKFQQSELAKRNIYVEADKISNIQVDSATFELIKDIALKDGAVYGFGAEFTKSEINDANYAALIGLRTCGYPQPDDTFDFFDEVYKGPQRCQVCGIIPGPQTDPFRIKSDKIKYNAFQLEWIYDEIFVEREFYLTHLQEFVGSKPVVIHRSGKESTRFVQLDLPEADYNFDMSGMEFIACKACQRKKYSPSFQDFLPQLPRDPETHIFQTREFFGTGAQAFRLIIMSQKIRQIFLDHKLAKWYNFTPLKNSSFE